jgi:hypothetical protein
LRFPAHCEHTPRETSPATHEPCTHPARAGWNVSSSFATTFSTSSLLCSSAHSGTKRWPCRQMTTNALPQHRQFLVDVAAPNA